MLILPRRLSSFATHLSRKLAHDECGAALTAELTLIVSAVVAVAATGLNALANATAQELGDLANAVQVDQSYSYNGLSSPGANMTRQRRCHNRECQPRP